MGEPAWVLLGVASITALGAMGAAWINTHRVGRVEGQVTEMNERLAAHQRQAERLADKMDQLVRDTRP